MGYSLCCTLSEPKVVLKMFVDHILSFTFFAARFGEHIYSAYFRLHNWVFCACWCSGLSVVGDNYKVFSGLVVAVAP